MQPYCQFFFSEGAVLTIDGEETEYVTDAEGKVIFVIAEAGSYVVSAVSDTLTLVPLASSE